jgi:small subunit ribosomal protein S20
MANLKSSKKNILINERNHKRNLHFKSKMKNLIKKAINAIEEKLEDRVTILQETLKVIDKTASKGIIKKGTAARKKSRLTIALNRSLLEPKVVEKVEVAPTKTKAKAKPKTAAKTKAKIKA